MEPDPDDVLDLVGRRLPFLEGLAEEPMGVSDLAETADSSRSTANRTVRELEDAGLIERADSGGYALTLPGQLLTDRYLATRRETAGILDAEPVLSRLPQHCTLDPSLVAGCEVETASGPAPYQPRERLLGAVRTAERYRVALPVLGDPRHLRAWHELVVNDGGTVELFVPRRLLEELREEFPRRLATMAETDRLTVRTVDVPDCVLAVAEGPSSTALLGAVEDGQLVAVLENDGGAVREATRRLDRLAADATEVTGELRSGEAPDAGRSATNGEGGATPSEAQAPLVRGAEPTAPGERGETLVRAAAVARGQGDRETACERLRAAFDAFREAGATEDALQTADALVELYDTLEDHETAAECCREAVSVAETADLADRAATFRERCRRLEAEAG